MLHINDFHSIGNRGRFIRYENSLMKTVFQMIISYLKKEFVAIS